MDLSYEINRTKPRRGHKYTKYKMRFSMMRLSAITNTYATSYAELTEKVGNTEMQLKSVFFI